MPVASGASTLLAGVDVMSTRAQEWDWRCKDNAYRMCDGMMGDAPKYWTTYEVAAPCPLEPEFPYPAATCDGNVRLQCRPVVVDGKAVFMVRAEDCTLEQRVCRSVGTQAGCVMP